MAIIKIILKGVQYACSNFIILHCTATAMVVTALHCYCRNEYCTVLLLQTTVAVLLHCTAVILRYCSVQYVLRRALVYM